jgi:hypothetical protein
MIIVPKNINAAQSFRVGPLIINNNKLKKKIMMELTIPN